MSFVFNEDKELSEIIADQTKEYWELDRKLQRALKALQTVIGHTKCYCEECKELSRKYWSPGKVTKKTMEENVENAMNGTL